MDTERADYLQRNCVNMPPPKQLTPAKMQQTISVAPMFNRQKKDAAPSSKDQQLAVTTFKSVVKAPSNGLARYSKIRSSSQTSHKVGKSLQKTSSMHTIAVAFKSVSLAVLQCTYSSVDVLQVQQTTIVAICSREPL